MVGLNDSREYFIVSNENICIQSLGHLSEVLDLQKSDYQRVLYKYILEYIKTDDMGISENNYGLLIEKRTTTPSYKMFINIRALNESIKDTSDSIKKYVANSTFTVEYDGDNCEFTIVTNAGNVTIRYA